MNPFPEIKTTSYLQLKITLRLNPGYQVWRRIWVRANTKCSTLHKKIQKAFGWKDYHLHQFEFGACIPTPKYTLVPAYDMEDCLNTHPQVRDESTVKLPYCFLFGTKFQYIYDLGDNWIHDIELEAVLDTIPEGVPTGEGDTPPEDVGGIDGFDEFRKAIYDPNDPEYESYRRWVGMKKNDKRWR